MKILDVKPTVFIVRSETGLQQLVHVTIESPAEVADTRLMFVTPHREETTHLGTVPAGRSTHDIYIEDIREEVPARLELHERDELHDRLELSWHPQKHWEVYLVQYAHHDLGYTDLPSNVLDEYDGFMDDVLAFCEETEHWPEDDARFRYQCEQFWSVEHYIKNRPPQAIDRLIHYVKNGQIEITALFGNQTLELCGHEELVRLLYPAFELKRQYGIEISSAEHNDVPGFTWALASVLAGAGVRYFSPGVPWWYFGRTDDDRVHPLWDTERALPLGTPSACWWEGPDGARVLLWSDLHGGEWQPYDYDEAYHELPGLLSKLEDVSFPYDMVSYTLRGGGRDNAPPSLRYSYLVREWNQRWAYPRLINSTNRPFLEGFERRWGDTLKLLRGDVPGTDYPVGATGNPRETALDRNTHDQLLGAETWATLASILTHYDYPKAVIDKAYRETFIYDLHAWGLSHAGGPAQDAHWSEKGDRAYRAAALAHDVLDKAANQIVDAVAYPDDGYYVTVFNALSDQRSQVVQAQAVPWGSCSMPMHWEPPTENHPWPTFVSSRAIGRRPVIPPADLFERPFQVVDADTGEPVPYQVVTLSDPHAASLWAPERVALGKVKGYEGHTKSLLFTARELPSVGFKTYRVVPCAEWPEFAGEWSADSHVLENKFYRITVDDATGTLASIYDKLLQRELVDSEARHKFGQLIIRSAETAEEELAQFQSLSLVDNGPISSTIRINATASCCPRVVVEITLYHESKRIDLSARLLRDSTPMLEVYFAFPFAVPEPQFRFEAGDAVIEPLRDQWPGSNTDYYGVQHWVEAFNDTWGITWSALDTPMAELGGLYPGYVSQAHHGARGPEYGHPFLEPGEITKGHIYAMVSYNNFRTNFINVSPNEFVVRYSFTSHSGNWHTGQARRFGWAVANPPVPIWMRGPQTSGTLPLSASFCQIDAPNVMLLTFKPAEDGNGYILRLIETEGEETPVRIGLPGIPVRHAFETNLVEENQRVLSCGTHELEIVARPFAIHTLRICAQL